MGKEAMLWEPAGGKKVHCFLCGHGCRISESDFGICGVRQNLEGALVTHSYGKLIAANVDPIEKKPLYHFLPGTRSFSIAAPGCNFRCGFCQNWQISQQDARDPTRYPGRSLSPEQIVAAALQQDCSSISYTYTEPTIFFEYAFESARLATEQNIRNVFVTNGFMTREAIRLIHPYLDAANVDLKSFRPEFYKKVCHGRIGPVLDSIREMKGLGIWVEVRK